MSKQQTPNDSYKDITLIERFYKGDM